MKFKKIAAIVACLFTLVSINSSVFAETGGGETYSTVYYADQLLQASKIPVKVSINGEILETDDAQAELCDGRIYVPMSFVKRYIASSMTTDKGLTMVDFDNGRLVFYTKNRDTTSYDYPVTYAGTPYNSSGTIMCPIRTVACVYNYQVRYNSYTRIAELYQ